MLLDEEDGTSKLAQLDYRVHDCVSGKRGEAECGFVGDEHHGRVGEHRRQAQHLLLPAGEQPGLLLSALGEDREALIGPLPQLLVAQRDGEVLLDGESRKDAAGFGDEEGHRPVLGGTGRAGDVIAGQLDDTHGGLEYADGDRAQRRLPSTVGSEKRGDLASFEPQVDAVENLSVSVARDDVRHRERRGTQLRTGARPGGQRGYVRGRGSTRRAPAPRPPRYGPGGPSPAFS